MALSLVTGPTVEPLSLAAAKLHLRVEAEAEHDLIRALITAAREHVENFTHRALITQTWDLALDDWPCDEGPLWLPLPPCQSVTSISYVDTAGATQTWAASLWDEDLPVGPYARMGRILPAYGQSYPTLRTQMNAVTVRFVAGYGATPATVPVSLVQAMKILIGTWFMPGRQGVALDQTVTLIPQTVDALLWPFKAF